MKENLQAANEKIESSNLEISILKEMVTDFLEDRMKSIEIENNLIIANKNLIQDVLVLKEDNLISKHNEKISKIENSALENLLEVQENFFESRMKKGESKANFIVPNKSLKHEIAHLKALLREKRMKKLNCMKKSKQVTRLRLKRICLVPKNLKVDSFGFTLA